MGAPAARRGLRRLNDSLLTRLLRGLPGVDIRIVADPTLRGHGPEAEQPRAPEAEQRQASAADEMPAAGRVLE
jgi:hypothetical protein